jgi:hypothetical protein
MQKTKNILKAKESRKWGQADYVSPVSTSVSVQ